MLTAKNVVRRVERTVPLALIRAGALLLPCDSAIVNATVTSAGAEPLPYKKCRCYHMPPDL